MFENNVVQKRIMKRKSYMDELEAAQKDGKFWRVHQLESKIYDFNVKHYPNIFWNSSEKGTYKKPVESEEN